MFASLGISNNRITYEKFYNPFTRRINIIDEHKVTECIQLLLWFIPIFYCAISNDISEIAVHKPNLSQNPRPTGVIFFSKINMLGRAGNS